MYFSLIKGARTQTKFKNNKNQVWMENFFWHMEYHGEHCHCRHENLFKYKKSAFKLENCRKINEDGKIIKQD